MMSEVTPPWADACAPLQDPKSVWKHPADSALCQDQSHDQEASKGHTTCQQNCFVWTATHVVYCLEA
eukprot:7715860-Karenia_brevis.AAC.1